MPRRFIPRFREVPSETEKFVGRAQLADYNSSVVDGGDSMDN
jgi:hypothetical protein